MDAHVELLRNRFLQRLQEESVREILDVGCGSGSLLQPLAQQGCRVMGVEHGSTLPEEPFAPGVPCLRASAEQLPFATDSISWVCMRHVLHHLENPTRALLEMLRVSRDGVLIAEPWFDPTLPEQGVAKRLESWARRQDRRAGRIHHEDHSPSLICALLPKEVDATISYEHYLPRAACSLDEVRARMDGYMDAIPEGHPDLRVAEEVWRDAREHGVGRNGTAVLKIRMKQDNDPALEKRS